MKKAAKKHFQAATDCTPEAGMYRFSIDDILLLMTTFAKAQVKEHTRTCLRCEQHIPPHSLGSLQS